MKLKDLPRLTWLTLWSDSMSDDDRESLKTEVETVNAYGLQNSFRPVVSMSSARMEYGGSPKAVAKRSMHSKELLVRSSRLMSTNN
ncbi:MAG: hypothetical protein R3C56_35770 [Pirellulaceae bacterium]